MQSIFSVANSTAFAEQIAKEFVPRQTSTVKVYLRVVSCSFPTSFATVSELLKDITYLSVLTQIKAHVLVVFR